MKLLAIEACQFGTYARSRYQQVEAYGADLYVLNGEGTLDMWPEHHYRLAGSKKIDDIITQARAWHAMHRFEGVFTFAESSVTAVAAVAEALGLPGIGVPAARTSRNKLLMKQAYEHGDVPHARYRYVTSVDDALTAASRFGYPVVTKPTLGTASQYVFRADSAADLSVRYRQAVEGLPRLDSYLMEPDGIDPGPHGLMIESFLDGREFLIEALAWDDEVYLGSVVDRVTVEGDCFDDDVHAAPTALSHDELAEVHRAVAAGARAQGLRRAAMHAEVRFHRGEPHVLEIAARPGGGGLDYMARLSAGYCPIRAVMKVAIGARPDVGHYRPTGTHTAALALLCRAGRIEEITVPDVVSSCPELFFLKITARPGDVILRPPDGNDIIGFLGATGVSRDDALARTTELASAIQVRLGA